MHAPLGNLAAPVAYRTPLYLTSSGKVLSPVDTRLLLTSERALHLQQGLQVGLLQALLLLQAGEKAVEKTAGQRVQRCSPEPQCPHNLQLDSLVDFIPIKIDTRACRHKRHFEGKLLQFILAHCVTGAKHGLLARGGKAHPYRLQSRATTLPARATLPWLLPGTALRAPTPLTKAARSCTFRSLPPGAEPVRRPSATANIADRASASRTLPAAARKQRTAPTLYKSIG